MPLTIPFDTTYLTLPDRFYSKQSAAPVSAPELIVFNHALGRQADLPGRSLNRDPIPVALRKPHRIHRGPGCEFKDVGEAMLNAMPIVGAKRVNAVRRPPLFHRRSFRAGDAMKDTPTECRPVDVPQRANRAGSCGLGDGEGRVRQEQSAIREQPVYGLFTVLESGLSH